MTATVTLPLISRDTPTDCLRRIRPPPDAGNGWHAHAFVLQQNLDGLGQIALEDFAVYEVPVDDLEARTGLRFDPTLASTAPRTIDPLPQRLRSATNVAW